MMSYAGHKSMEHTSSRRLQECYRLQGGATFTQRGLDTQVHAAYPLRTTLVPSLRKVVSCNLPYTDTEHPPGFTPHTYKKTRIKHTPATARAKNVMMMAVGRNRGFQTRPGKVKSDTPREQKIRFSAMKLSSSRTPLHSWRELSDRFHWV